MLLAAAGQLNMNLENCAKQGHHKKSVQLYSRDDVWPSLFLQRDTLVDVSTGWRPLTSQARGAKQPLPEPWFCSPALSQEDLNLLQMSQPKTTTLSQISKPPETIATDSDEQVYHRPIQVTDRKKKLLFLLHHPSWWWTPNHMSYMLHALQRVNVLENPLSMTKERPLKFSVVPLYWIPPSKWSPKSHKAQGFVNAKLAWLPW